MTTKKQTLWVAVDGLLTFDKIEGQVRTQHEEWCDIVRDALLERRWEAAYRMLQKHDEDEMTEPVDALTYTLPMFVAPSIDAAIQLRTAFCKLGIGDHPLLQPKTLWYYLPNFNGGVEEVHHYATQFDVFLKTGVRGPTYRAPWTEPTNISERERLAARRVAAGRSRKAQ